MTKSACLFLILTLTVNVVFAQQEAAKSSSAKSADQRVDPTGAWVWEQQFGPNTTTRELRLRFEGDQLVGELNSNFPSGGNVRRGNNEPSAIEKVKLEGDELTFEVTRRFGNRGFTTQYACVFSGDELAGFSRVDFGGQVRETPWMATRIKADETDPETPVNREDRTLAGQPETTAEIKSPATAETAGPAVIAQPMRVPAPGPQSDGAYQPLPILPGGIVVTLYDPASPHLNQDRIGEPERYNMTGGVPGRIQSIVNIHNPSIEVHFASPSMNTGTVVIVAAGGGHRMLNVGTESADFVPYFYNYGISTVILRNRLRSDGYEPTTDAVRDAMQAIRLVRKNAQEWRFDPHRIGIMGFSAGAELAAPAAVGFDKFDRDNQGQDDPLAGTSSRPDFVGVIYPGPTPFSEDPEAEVPRNAPPAFITCAGAGDRIHAIWADDYFRAMLNAGVPNVEIHIYGNGFHPGTRGATGGLTHRNGIPFGKWPDRFIEWADDLGFLNEPGGETKAARDSIEFVSQPPGRPRGFRRR